MKGAKNTVSSPKVEAPKAEDHGSGASHESKVVGAIPIAGSKVSKAFEVISENVSDNVDTLMVSVSNTFSYLVRGGAHALHGASHAASDPTVVDGLLRTLSESAIGWIGSLGLTGFAGYLSRKKWHEMVAALKKAVDAKTPEARNHALGEVAELFSHGFTFGIGVVTTARNFLHGIGGAFTKLLGATEPAAHVSSEVVSAAEHVLAEGAAAHAPHAAASAVSHGWGEALGHGLHQVVPVLKWGMAIAEVIAAIAAARDPHKTMLQKTLKSVEAAGAVGCAASPFPLSLLGAAISGMAAMALHFVPNKEAVESNHDDTKAEATKTLPA